MNIKILVATHKPYRMPADRNLYLPIFVGKEFNNIDDDQFIGDNSGDNISEKNKNYNELTALYWAWKNLNVNYIGLVHYRRHFKSASKFKKKFDKLITMSEIENILKDYDMILPIKRNYYIETTYSQYVHAHYEKDLLRTRDIIELMYPEYTDSFDSSMKKKSSHRFNMFIMKKKDFDDYAEWLFNILFELESVTDISEYDAYQSRIYGFISERLFDVWLNKQSLTYKEVPVMHMEHQNWLIKGTSFIKRKIAGGKNE